LFIISSRGGKESNSIGKARYEGKDCADICSFLCTFAAGSPATWLKCPLVGRSFVLDLLEFVLLHRPAAFQAHSAFKALLQTKVGADEE
jgi:hypothetical protein